MHLVRAALLTIVVSTFSPSIGDSGLKPTSYVNPFIGTANSGNTFPGAVRPWGMVSVSPHTDLSAPSGYVDGRPWFFGLGQVHLSGTGCPDLGSIIITATSVKSSTDPNRYRCRLENQTATPGYWAGTLVEPSIRAEATATVRSGIIRLTPQSRGGFVVLVDAGRNLARVGGGSVHWKSDRELEGFNIGGGFCGEANRNIVYFAAVLSRSPSDKGIWRDTLVSRKASATADQSSIGAWAQFEGENSDPLEIRIGISYVSVRNARANLNAETAHLSFEEIASEASLDWDRQLSRVRVSGGTNDELTEFYTALYHSLIHPNVISDVNGEYPLFGRHGTGKNTTRDHYTVFSLWDTYRTLHPLLSLFYPERQSAIVNTMLDMYRESGWLPKWELAGTETHLMVGDGAIIVLADTYLKGVRGFDTTLAFQAMRKPGVVLTPDAQPSRPGYSDYLRLGYIPIDQDTSRPWWVWGPVSTTLEYCLADWAFSQMAEALGHHDEAVEFLRRSCSYRNLEDPTTQFLRPRDSHGRWLSPFDPLQTEGAGSWTGSGGPGYVEGNAWQYNWFVPHDVRGHAKAFGSIDHCAERLEQFFASGQFTMNNEPDIAYPYLFTYFPGREYRAGEIVRRIMDRDFDCDASGLPGNDDAGTISAWFVFSALGLYPACPASAEYRLGYPLFEHVEILLDPEGDNSRRIRIDRRGSRDTDARVQEISWNGKRLPGYQIRHAELNQGGNLLFTLSR
jgi:predicted alpha-1,2-mannosidase